MRFPLIYLFIYLFRDEEEMYRLVIANYEEKEKASKLLTIYFIEIY